MLPRRPRPDRIESRHEYQIRRSQEIPPAVSNYPVGMRNLRVVGQLDLTRTHLLRPARAWAPPTAAPSLWQGTATPGLPGSVEVPM